MCVTDCYCKNKDLDADNLKTAFTELTISEVPDGGGACL